MRDAPTKATGANIAVVIADSDRPGRPPRGHGDLDRPRRSRPPPRDRASRQATRMDVHDLITAAAGIILGRRGRGAPVAVLRGTALRAGRRVASMLHHRP
ncbi:hypothetical protein AB0O01_35460 [Streptomyces sp. NPDC093252]|uniref:hypothetical protein n=1 Tax=Streptomyces sp. NPDC093252 TaxID=3154980 RepID=UPI00342F009A